MYFVMRFYGWYLVLGFCVVVLVMGLVIVFVFVGDDDYEYCCGLVINLFLFCYVLLKVMKVNVCWGFFLIYCIDWIFKCWNMLLVVIVEYGYWCCV